jgi:hypothetical protein
MSLADLIRKGGLREAATATPATVATVRGQKAGSVAEVARVAVAGEPGRDAGKDDVLRTFPGPKVIPLPRRCEHCGKSKELKGAPSWRRRGRIVPRVWPNGQREWACHFCGRAVKS